MNKLPLFLAFAFFALVACSSDGEPEYHAECSKSTKACLAGVWKLKYVEKETGGNAPCNYEGDYNDRENRDDLLTLEKNGDFSFSGGIGDRNVGGEWVLSDDGTKMEIICIIDCNYAIENSTADIKVTKAELRVTAPGYALFSQCAAGSSRLTEVFSWVGSKK